MIILIFFSTLGGFSGAVTIHGESSSLPFNADLLWEESDLFLGVPLLLTLGMGRLVEDDFVLDPFEPPVLVSTEEVVAWWCWWWSFLEGSGMPDPVVAPLDTGRAEVDLRTGRAVEVGEGMLDPPPWRTEADWVVGFLLEGVGILLPGRGMLEGFATSVLDNLLWGS